MNINEYIDNENRIYVCWADISSVNPDENTSLMSRYRLSRIERSKGEAAKIQSAGVELMLVHAVRKCFPGAAVPVEYAADDKGKPYFSDIDAYFSLSHSGCAAVCAVSDTPVGVDVQKEKKSKKLLIDKYFTSAERVLAVGNGGFTRIWARKEAALKAEGTGIGFGLGKIDVSGDTLMINGLRYMVKDIDLGMSGYRMAVSCVVRSDL